MWSSIPLSEYASELEEHVKQRYLQKISSIGVDPALIEGKLTLRTLQPDCLPPVESIDLLCYLVLETSFYAQQQFEAFRSFSRHATRLEISRHAFGNFAPRVWKFRATRLEISRHAFGNFTPRVWKFRATRLEISCHAYAHCCRPRVNWVCLFFTQTWRLIVLYSHCSFRHTMAKLKEN